MDYDPNLNYCGKTTIQTVKLTFAQWDYRLTIETKVSGNCSGLSVIRAAIENVADDNDSLDFVRPDGEVLTVEQEDDEISWLANMLICAEIVDIVPSER